MRFWRQGDFGTVPSALAAGVPAVCICLKAPPRRLLITDSLAEQVSGPVRTYTLLRPRFGKAVPAGGVAPNPSEVEWKPMGVIGWPVTGSVVGCLSLNTVNSNVSPAVNVVAAIIYAGPPPISR